MTTVSRNPKAILLLVLLAFLGSAATASDVRAAEGDLDRTFGDRGRASVFMNGYAVLRAIAVDGQGRILAAGHGSSGDDFVLARLHADGTLDRTFGKNGVARAAVGDYAGVNDIVIDPVGRIVAVGAGRPEGGTRDFGVVRFLPDGSLDASFGGDGRTMVAIGSGADQARSVALDPQGRIVAAGSTWNGTNYDFAVARLLPDGTPDAGFDGDGKTTLSFGSEAESEHNPGEGANGVAVDSQGRVVVVGDAREGFRFRFGVARLLLNGALDPSFGGTGNVVTQMGESGGAGDVLIDAAGRIVVGGSSSGRFGLVRYLADGSLDPDFGGNGKVTSFIGHTGILALALDSRERIVATGSESFDSGDPEGGTVTHVSLARYLDDGSTDDTFRGNEVGQSASGSGTSVAIDAQDRITVAGGPIHRLTGDETTTIDFGPVDGSATRDPTPMFEFSSSTAGSTFSCRLDGGSWLPCTAPRHLGPLEEGNHNFEVRSTSPSGVTDPTPAASAFVVDMTAPDTVFDSSTPRPRGAQITFHSTEPGAELQCAYYQRNDGSFSWSQCESPFRFEGFPGPFSLEIRSVDRAGNVDPTPAVAQGVIDPQPGVCKNRKSGTSGADIMIGSESGDSLNGFYGDDRIEGRGGEDCLEGQSGDDVVSGGDEHDELDGGPGSDRLYGGADADEIEDLVGRDTVGGGGGADSITTRDSNRDVIRCGGGRDRVQADRKDRVSGDCERIVRRPSGPPCTILGTRRSDTLRGTPGRDLICGYGGNDRLSGLGGNDVLYGGPGEDHLNGGKGEDELRGGDGDDSLTGGAQSDELYGDDGDDTISGGPGGDVISGGEGRDRVDGGGGSDVVYGRRPA